MTEATNSPYIHTRYTGECRDCGALVQSTPKSHVNSNEPEIWVRCSCGQITLCEEGDATNNDGSTDQ